MSENDDGSPVYSNAKRRKVINLTDSDEEGALLSTSTPRAPLPPNMIDLSTLTPHKAQASWLKVPNTTTTTTTTPTIKALATNQALSKSAPSYDSKPQQNLKTADVPLKNAECPVCNNSFPGFTEQQLSVHIDDCLTQGYLKGESGGSKEKEKEHDGYLADLSAYLFIYDLLKGVVLFVSL